MTNKNSTTLFVVEHYTKFRDAIHSILQEGEDMVKTTHLNQPDIPFGFIFSDRFAKRTNDKGSCIYIFLWKAF